MHNFFLHICSCAVTFLSKLVFIHLLLDWDKFRFLLVTFSDCHLTPASFLYFWHVEIIFWEMFFFFFTCLYKSHPTCNQVNNILWSLWSYALILLTRSGLSLLRIDWPLMKTMQLILLYFGFPKSLTPTSSAECAALVSCVPRTFLWWLIHAPDSEQCMCT